MSIENVKMNLDKNERLTEEVKDGLFDLINLFHYNFPEVSLDLLEQRIQTLTTERVNQYITKKVSHYNSGTNCIQMNEESLRSAENVDFHVMKSILDMITQNEKDSKHMLDAYHEGMSVMFSSNLVGRDENERYTPEESLTQMICSVVGLEKAMDAYFKNDPEVLVTYLSDEGMKMEDAVSFLEKMSHDQKTRGVSQKSSYKNLVGQFVGSFENGIKKEQSEVILEFLVDNPSYFENDSIDFGDLSDLSNMVSKVVVKETVNVK